MRLASLTTLWLLLASLLLIPMLQSEEIKRAVLALYNSGENPTFRDDRNSIHLNAEMPLNWLGLHLLYHDINKGLPPSELTERADCILTWFWTNTMRNAADYCSWLDHQISDGKRVVILGSLGAYMDQESGEPVPSTITHGVLSALGVEYLGNWTTDSTLITLDSINTEMMNFEVALTAEDLTFYQQIRSLSPENTVYLKLNRTDLKEGISDAIVLTPRGGFCMANYFLQHDSRTGQRRWYLDPFLFFAQAFQWRDPPRLDTTTLFGRRLFFAHVDGNGFQDATRIDNNQTAGQVCFHQIFQKYPLPASVSLISCEIDPYFFGTDKSKNLASRTVHLPNIELASHTFSNPILWSRKITSHVIEGYSKPIHYSFETQEVEEGKIDESNAALVTVPWDTYLHTETLGSIEYLSSYVGGEKRPCQLIQWSGDFSPPAEAIALVTQIGLPNLNGGVSRMDTSHPSYTNLAPLARQTEHYVQPYSAISGDSLFTNFWHGPMHGMLLVLNTLRQTEETDLFEAPPRRVKPCNLHYHFLSGVFPAALGALQRVYDTVQKQPCCPIMPSRYARMVLDFHKATLSRPSETSWKVEKYGECRTLRLDSLDHYPDLEKSQNVLGHHDWKEFRYIHLAEGTSALLVLSNSPSSTTYLDYSGAYLTKVQLSQEEITFTALGWRSEKVAFRNLAPNSLYSVALDTSRDSWTVSTDSEGYLEVELPLKGETLVTIHKQH